jgi:LmbE family N-acetylglucosaminyl deacetylase
VTTPQPVHDFDHIYLSPHLDDAVLSCGGRIGQQAAAGGRVLVVTLCAGDVPPGPLSDFAQSLHDRWELPRTAPEMRREEDRAALAALGAEALHWPLPDCIYRRANAADGGEALYTSEESLFGPLHPLEWWLSGDVAEELAEAIPLQLETEVYVPIGIGSHVDHQLVWRVADDWVGAHARVLYYEDYPYSEDPDEVTKWVEGRGWSPQLAWLSEADLERKAQAIACYRSQLSTFWPDEVAMRAALREHTAQAGGEGRLAERVWYNPASRGPTTP